MTKPLKLVYTENGFDTGSFLIDDKLTEYSPADLMLMSIASCSAIVFRNILKKTSKLYRLMGRRHNGTHPRRRKSYKRDTSSF